MKFVKNENAPILHFYVGKTYQWDLPQCCDFYGTVFFLLVIISSYEHDEYNKFN